MKKFITLLCAVALTLGASAANSPKKLAMDVPVKKTEFHSTTPQSRHAVAEVSDTVRLAILDYGSTDYTALYNFVYYSMSTEQSKRFMFAIYTDSADVKSGVVYTLEDMESNYTWCMDTLGGVGLEFDSVTFLKTVTESSIAYDVNVWVGDTIFILDYLFMKPIVSKYDTIVATDLELDARDIDYYIEEYGFGVFTALSAKGEVALQFVGADDPVGTFDESVVGGSIKGSGIFSGSVTVAEVDDNYTVVGDLLVNDSTLYHIDLSYVIPVPTDTIDIVLNAGIVYAYLEDGVWESYWGGDEDDYALSLVLRTEEEVAGIYTTDELYARKYNMVLDVKNDSAIYVINLANLVVVVDENDTCAISGSVVAVNQDDDSDVIMFNLTLAGARVFNPIDYDENTMPWMFNFSEGETSVESGNLYVNAYNATLLPGQDIFYVNLVFTGEALTPGVYDIVDGGEEGAFTAGYLVTSQQGSTLKGCYIRDYFYEYIWFMIEGTITVAENGDMTIAAINSYGLPIIGTIYMAQTPVENANAADGKPCKILRNGQIILQVNGRQFNVSGQEL